MANNDSSAILVSAMRRFQRRLRLAAFTRYLTVASALALVVVDVIVLGSFQDLALVAAFTTSLAFAAVASVVLAILRTPSLPDTARIVDRTLRLQDRAVSALQFSRTTDPIARIVVEDAASRLEAVPLSRLPLSISMTARWLGASALIVSMAIVGVREGPRPDATIRSGSGVATTDPGGRPQNPQPRYGETGATTATNQGGGATVARSTPAGDAPQQLGASAQRGGPGTAEPSDRVAAEDPTDQNPTGPVSSSSQPDPRVAAAGSAPSSAQGRASGSATLNGPASAASGPGAAAAGAARRAGGGVRDGALVASGSRPAQAAPPPSTDRRTAAYAEAYARAEAAVPPERVPADLRSYVRAYFLAIRPGSNP